MCSRQNTCSSCGRYEGERRFHVVRVGSNGECIEVRVSQEAMQSKEAGETVEDHLKSSAIDANEAFERNLEFAPI